MPHRTTYYVRIVDPGDHALMPNQDIEVEDMQTSETVALSLSAIFPRTLAFSVRCEEDGNETMRVLERYGFGSARNAPSPYLAG